MPIVPKHQSRDDILWETVEVDGRRVRYGVAGHGLPVLFVHGWALGSHAYKGALKRLVRLGCRVYAPCLPEFGGSAGLPNGRCDLDGYAIWADHFLDAVGVDEPVLAIGHSFGGAVATKLAHDFPDRVAHLVLINSVGGGVWSRSETAIRYLAERPLWHWAFNFPMDILTERGVLPTVSAILSDAIPNLVTNPLGMWKAASVARSADLVDDLRDLKGEGMPMTVLWGEGDSIIPRASFEATCEAAGVTGHLVPGRHSWLLADPEAFAGGVVEAVTSALASRRARAGLSRLPHAAAG